MLLSALLGDRHPAETPVYVPPPHFVYVYIDFVSLLYARKAERCAKRTQEAGDNPVQSLCRILAEDSQWRPGAAV